MFCRWLSTIAGTYFIKDKFVGLDYHTLASDSLSVQLTLVHESIHNILNNSTEYGLATSDIFNILDDIKQMSSGDKNKIKKLLYLNQIFVQEGTASLIEMLILQHKYNRTTALSWAQKNFPEDYYQRFEKLQFVMEFSQKYRDLFRNKVPRIALQTNIREAMVKQDLLNSPQEFIKYLSTEINIPDKRLEKIIKKIRYNGGIINKEDKIICDESGIDFYFPPNKKDIANYLNYLQKVSGKINHHFIEKDIGYAKKPKEILQESINNAVVTNLNMNLADNGIDEWNIDNFLHYKDSIEAIFVSRIGNDEKKDMYKILSGKTCDASIIGFTKTNEKYVTAVDSKTLLSLLDNEFKNTTLIVKWGLFSPTNNELEYFPKSRKPDVVIFNTITSLQ